MRTNAVRVYLRGGLGNQLFQYGAALELSRRTGTELIMDCTLLPKNESSREGISSWPEQISSFNHSGVIEFNNKGTCRHWIATRTAQLQRLIGDMIPRLLYSSGTYAHETIDPVIPLTSSIRPMRINAYCNSSDFFPTVGQNLKNEVRSLRNPSDWFLQTQEMIHTTKPVAVHLRLGDYKNLEAIYGKMTRDYFEKSKDLVWKLSEAKNFLIFSDEPELAEAFFGATSLKGKVVVAPPSSPPLESILLMSQCEGLIASNSSFSWWAAYLMDDICKPVVFPRPLFKTESRKEPKNWLLDHWIQVGNRG